MVLRWFKNLFGITKLEESNRLLLEEVHEYSLEFKRVLKQLQDFVKIDADLGFRSNNTIIVTGRFRNREFVNFYDVGDGDFVSLVNQLQHLKKFGNIRNVDAPESFKASWEI